MEYGSSIPQTPLGTKVPSLDMSKVAGMTQQELPQSTTNKSSGKLLLQSPSAANARNALNERANKAFDGKDK